jgi:hypothetical protein
MIAARKKNAQLSYLSSPANNLSPFRGVSLPLSRVGSGSVRNHSLAASAAPDETALKLKTKIAARSLSPLAFLRQLSPARAAISTIAGKLRIAKKVTGAPVVPKQGMVARLMSPIAEDDRDEEELGKGSMVLSARMRERARVRHIMQHPAAEGRASAALYIATKTHVARHAAVRLLQSLPVITESDQSSAREGFPRGQPYIVTRAS